MGDVMAGAEAERPAAPAPAPVAAGPAGLAGLAAGWTLARVEGRAAWIAGGDEVPTADPVGPFTKE